VCSGNTGHVEVAQVTFDPDKVSYEDLVTKYFEIHDPTQLNRQGPDVGYQYRSVIFAHSDEQAETARRVIEGMQGRLRDPIVTTIEPAAPFWRAEEYHQCYLQRRQERTGLLGTLLGH
jgi:peptide-methionine (S)-S-oxide reductase